MKSSSNLGRLVDAGRSPHWSFLIVLFWVASTSLAAGAVLAVAVDAAFVILAVFAGANLLFMALVACLAKRRQTRGATAAPTTQCGDEDTSRRSMMRTADESPSFIVLQAHARAEDMTRVLFARQSYFPVAQGREIVGSISKGRLLSAVAHGQGDQLIAELMSHAGGARQYEGAAGAPQ